MKHSSKNKITPIHIGVFSGKILMPTNEHKLFTPSLKNALRNTFAVSGFLLISLFSLKSPAALGSTPTKKGITIDVNTKHPNDKKLYRSLTLANKLEVLLISDISYNKSAAALDVNVGSHEDPISQQGLAHFLEHVLFLGTKTFPEPDEFVSFLEANQGNWNAYTASESTNYHFDINHDSFEGALKRFSLFFIEPTFNKKFVSKERNAVHSEFQKNLDIDSRRLYRVYQQLIRKGHPARTFGVGNQETLGQVEVDAMKAFYKKHYSSNIMKLVLMSKLPLDKMESLAKKYFLPIKNNSYKLTKYDSQTFPADNLPAEINVKTLKDTKELELIFPIPMSLHGFWKTSPGGTLGHLLGHEGKASLLSLLKRKNLASGIYSSVPSTSYSSSFSVTITLTDQGLKKTDEIISNFFSYIKLVNKNGYQKYIFDEQSKLAAIAYVYRDQREGVGVASHLANSMQRLPALDIEKNLSLLHEYGPQDFKTLAKFITPSNLIIINASKNVSTNKKEHFYGTDYKIRKINTKRLAAWKSAKLLPELHYPEPNKFVPKDLTVIKATKRPPEKIIDSKWGTFWFQPDFQFKLPKAFVNITILTDQVNLSPQDKMMANLYSFSLDRSLEEWKYPITLAGLGFTINRVDRGIRFSFSGYSENIPFLIQEITKKLKTITIDEQAFADIKDRLKRIIQNSYKSAAYQQANYHLGYLRDSLMIHPREYFNPLTAPESSQSKTAIVDLISKVTLAQVKEFSTKIYKNISIEGGAYGNLTKNHIANAINQIPIILKSKPLGANKIKKSQSIVLAPGTARAKKLTSTVSNSAWVSNYQFGKRTPLLEAQLAVAHAYLKASYFKDLRTKQQLGYIVASWISKSDHLLGMTFLIQSDKYSPREISDRTKTWMKQALEALKAMPADEFDGYKKSVATRFREKIKTISEQLARNMLEIYSLDEQFGYFETVAKSVESMSKSDMVTVFQRGFGEKTSGTLSVYLSKKGASPYKITEEIIKDDKSFKRNASYQ